MKQIILDTFVALVAIAFAAVLAMALGGCAQLEEPCGSQGDTDGVMCESELQATITVSSAFPAEHRQWAFQGAADQWALVTGRTAVHFEVVDGPADIELGSPICSGRSFVDAVSVGARKQAVLHYLGHRFGLGHVDGPHLMAAPDPTYSYIHEMSPGDAEHFDRLWQVRAP